MLRLSVAPGTSRCARQPGRCRNGYAFGALCRMRTFPVTGKGSPGKPGHMAFMTALRPPGERPTRAEPAREAKHSFAYDSTCVAQDGDNVANRGLRDRLAEPSLGTTLGMDVGTVNARRPEPCEEIFAWRGSALGVRRFAYHPPRPHVPPEWPVGFPPHDYARSALQGRARGTFLSAHFRFSFGMPFPKMSILECPFCSISLNTGNRPLCYVPCVMCGLDDGLTRAAHANALRGIMTG